MEGTHHAGGNGSNWTAEPFGNHQQQILQFHHIDSDELYKLFETIRYIEILASLSNFTISILFFVTLSLSRSKVQLVLSLMQVLTHFFNMESELTACHPEQDRKSWVKAEKQAKQRLRCLLALLFSPVPATLSTYHRNIVRYVRSFRLSHVVLRSCASSTCAIVNWVSKSYSQMHPVGQMNMALTWQGIARRFMAVKETVCRWVESLFDLQFKMRLAARHSSQAEIIEGIAQDWNKMWPNLSAQTSLFFGSHSHMWICWLGTAWSA